MTGWNGPGRARTVTNRAGTALTGAVRTGLEPPVRATSAEKERAKQVAKVTVRSGWCPSRVEVSDLAGKTAVKLFSVSTKTCFGLFV